MLKREEDSRIVNNELAVRSPARDLQIGILGEVCDRIAADLGTYPALSLILEGRIFNGEILDFGPAAAVFQFSGI
jgi:hypothetical protein